MTFPQSAMRLRSGARSSVVCARLVAGACAGASAARAQGAANDARYRQFGDQPGLVTLMDDLMLRRLADPRFGPFLKDVGQKRRIPCDHLPIRSWPLFNARDVILSVIESFKADNSLGGKPAPAST